MVSSKIRSLLPADVSMVRRFWVLIKSYKKDNETQESLASADVQEFDKPFKLW